jgi:hypothetical protein
MNMSTVPNGREPRNPRALDAASNVIPFPNPSSESPGPFERLNGTLALEQFRAGTLPEAVFVSFLVGLGLAP